MTVKKYIVAVGLSFPTHKHPHFARRLLTASTTRRGPLKPPDTSLRLPTTPDTWFRIGFPCSSIPNNHQGKLNRKMTTFQQSEQGQNYLAWMGGVPVEIGREVTELTTCASFIVGKWAKWTLNDCKVAWLFYPMGAAERSVALSWKQQLEHFDIWNGLKNVALSAFSPCILRVNPIFHEVQRWQASLSKISCFHTCRVKKIRSLLNNQSVVCSLLFKDFQSHRTFWRYGNGQSFFFFLHRFILYYILCCLNVLHK